MATKPLEVTSVLDDEGFVGSREATSAVKKKYHPDFHKTRLVEDIPETPRDRRWFLMKADTPSTENPVWFGQTEAGGMAWAEANGITVDEIERYQPRPPNQSNQP